MTFYLFISKCDDFNIFRELFALQVWLRSWSKRLRRARPSAPTSCAWRTTRTWSRSRRWTRRRGRRRTASARTSTRCSRILATSPRTTRASFRRWPKKKKLECSIFLSCSAHLEGLLSRKCLHMCFIGFSQKVCENYSEGVIFRISLQIWRSKRFWTKKVIFVMYQNWPTKKMPSQNIRENERGSQFAKNRVNKLSRYGKLLQIAKVWFSSS